MRNDIFHAAMMAAFLRPKWRLLETVTLEEAATSITKTYTGYKGFRVLSHTETDSTARTVTFTFKNGENTVLVDSISSLVDTSVKYAYIQGWLDDGVWVLNRTSALASEMTDTLKRRVVIAPKTDSDYTTCDSITISASNIPAGSVFKIYGLR